MELIMPLQELLQLLTIQFKMQRLIVLCFFSGVTNSGGSGALTITGNNILNGTNNGSGAFTGIISSAAVATANINNIIRSHSRTFAGAGALLLFQALVLLQRN
jgi:hypothetical protein